MLHYSFSIDSFLVFPFFLVRDFGFPIVFVFSVSVFPASCSFQTFLASFATCLYSSSYLLWKSGRSFVIAKYAGIIRGIEEQSAVVMDGILSDQVEPPTIDVQPEEE